MVDHPVPSFLIFFTLIQIIRLPFLYSHRINPSILSASLASTLSRFPIFTGRVRTTDDGYFEVADFGQGVACACASSPYRLSDLLPPGMTPEPASTFATTTNPARATASKMQTSSAPFKPPDLVPFYPETPRSLLGFLGKDVPLLHVKLTHLADGGTCLSVAIPHLLGDLDTCKTFISAWAAEYCALEESSDGSATEEESATREAEVSSSEEVDGGAAAAAAAHRYQGVDHQKQNKGASEGLSTPAKVLPVPLLTADALAAHASPALPPNYACRHFEPRTWGFLPKMVGSAMWHVVAAGGITTLAYHVPSDRLATLKAEATEGLARCGTPASPGWISTNDALAAKIWQTLAQNLPQKTKSSLFLSINLRKRLRPTLPSDSLGNCAWSVQVGEGQEDLNPSSASLGELAVAVRTAIQGLDVQAVSHGLRWVEDHLGGGKAMPVVIRGASNLLLQSGGVVLSHWDWDKDYRSAAFGQGPATAPLWHQPMEPRAPNCVFVLPAPSAAPGGGAVVFLTLHKKLAVALKAKCPTL